MSFPDKVLIALLALWALGSVLFLFRIPGLHRWLVRWNGSRAFVHWSLFSATDPSLRPATVELWYRDHDPAGRGADWRLGASGHASAWRAALWLPERFPAAAVQNVGRSVHLCVQRDPPAIEAANRHAASLAAYLRRVCPLAAGTTREHRLVRRFASDDSEEVLLSFSTNAHAGDS